MDDVECQSEIRKTQIEPAPTEFNFGFVFSDWHFTSFTFKFSSIGADS